MTQEDITRMAREADIDWHRHWNDDESNRLERFAALVAAAEREECAEICKKHADFYAGLEPSPIAQSAWAACIDNRDAIRTRGNT